jgi:hypothetical protein
MENNNEKLLNIKTNIIFNALDDGWVVSKKNNYYIFRKKHENRKEVLSDEYLKVFLSNNTKDHNK